MWSLILFVLLLHKLKLFISSVYHTRKTFSSWRYGIVELILIYDLLHFTGQDFTAAQRERAQEDFKVPHLTHPPIRIRKTATAPGSPYSFRIVRGFFYVPQNYKHSRNCETGPPTYRPYPRRLDSLTIC